MTVKPGTIEVLAGLAAILVGVGVWVLVEIATGVEAWDHRGYWTVGYPAMILVSGILGFSSPRRFWLWGLLIIGAQALWSFGDRFGQATLLPFTLLLLGVMVLPCIVAAYFGAKLRLRRSKSNSGQTIN